MNFLRLYRNMKMKNKLMLLNSLLILLTLSSVFYISYSQSSKSLNHENLNSTKQLLEQTESFLSYKISKILDVSDSLVLDGNLNEMLLRPVTDYSIHEQIRDFGNVSLNLSNLQMDDDIFRIRLYIPDELEYAYEMYNFFPYSEFAASQEYEVLKQHIGKVLWITDKDALSSMKQSDVRSVHSIRFIRNLGSLDVRLGVLNVDVREDVLEDIVKRAITSVRGVAYLQNSKGELIAESDQSQVLRWKLNLDKAAEIAGRDDNWEMLELGGEKVMAGAKQISGTDWNLVSIVSLREIYASSYKVRNQIFIFIVPLAIALNILVYYISRSQTRRIGMVIRKMRKVQSGELIPVNYDGSRDEAGQLVENFNYMVEQMKIILEEQYTLGQEAKSSEMRALHSQINPHFLYNTLDLINWTAIKHDVPEISSLVQSLSQFYKLSLNKGEEIITVGKELEHVQLYVDIQNRRFGNTIHLLIDVDEALFEYSMPKITLQPIVENSILHGIRETEERRGEIFIYSFREHNAIVLAVQDNGIGIPEERVHWFNTPGETSEKQDGYGIRNINHRIQLLYGLSYGLHFESRLGEGTTVEIRIPSSTPTPKYPADLL
ncbi:HAMP domain-containing protein [Paenibacillus sp. LMG 31459]|jgi:two-component system sensor histidine kinase YesM|uniref:histidine kinase n=1 Tax=Paenibacillus phytohabitans TaxID=2654978 RepID=A0ABX1YDF3_9BACL|nr:sensor histidine kinase [Paenibacillus phytohabitans]NOU79005.1 HAMP domain-containing protein [Paenibacillus phytohabitans]